MSGTPVSLSFVTSLINGSRNKNQDLKKILCDYLESNKDQNVSDLYNKVKGFEGDDNKSEIEKIKKILELMIDKNDKNI
ncbi:3682_t:CDS:2 [Entrophospora sp. SA101]|nr:3682_t:CDS:2 [Entrophospora sp. SA101]